MLTRQEDPSHHDNPPDSALARGNQVKTHYVDHKDKEIASLKILL